MYIQQFSIDGFGIFAEQHVNEVSSGLNIFLGNNEAGKSTCLEFFRAMLFGFMDGRGKNKLRQYPPLRGGSEGGILQLATVHSGNIRLERRRGAGGGLVSLTAPDGSQLDPTLLNQLLGGVTRDVFEAVYAFSLTELQTMDSLQDNNVKHALHGAAFGSGTRPVGQVLKELDNTMSGLFRPAGKKQAINSKLAELDKIRAALREHATLLPHYDTLHTERERDGKELEALLTERRTIRTEEERIRRHLTLWETWVQLQILSEEYVQLPPVADTFPQNGLERLELLLQKRADTTLTIQQHSNAITRLEHTLQADAPDAVLLAHEHAITGLQEHKERYRSGQEEITELSRECATLQASIHRSLEELGAGWDEETVRRADRSIFTREHITHFAQQLAQSATDVTTAHAAVANLTREHETGEHAVALAQQAVNHLGQNTEHEDTLVVDALMAGRAQVENYLTELPRRKQQQKRSEQKLDTALHSLVPGWTRAHLLAVDASRAVQMKLRALIKEQATAAEQHRFVAQSVAAAKEQCNTLAQRLALRTAEREKRENTAAEILTEQQIAEKRNTLKEIRQLLKEKAIAEAVRPAPPVLLPALLLAVIGITLLSSLFAPAPEGSGSSPFSLLTFAGVASCVGAAAVYLHARYRHRKSMAMGESQKDSELAALTLRFGKPFSTSTPADSTVSTAEDMLAAQQTQLAEQARLDFMIQELSEELALTSQRLERLTEELDAAGTAQQAIVHQQYTLLRELTLPENVSAEEALFIISQVDTLRERHEATNLQAEEINAMSSAIDEWCSAARTLPSLATISTPAALIAKAGSLLESLREQRSQGQERARAEEELRQKKDILARCATQQKEAEAHAANAAAAQNSLQAEWQDWLSNLGFAATLSPETAGKALDTITECQSTLILLTEKQGKLAAAQQQVEAFQQKQDTILTLLAGHFTPETDTTENTIDRIATTTTLHRALAAAREQEATHNSLRATLPEQKQLLEHAQMALTAIDGDYLALLTAGGAVQERTLFDDITPEHEETFRKHAAAYAKHAECRQKIEQLQATLTASAGEGGLDALAASFADTSNATREENVVQARELAEKLEQMDSKESILRQRIADTTAQLESLASANDMALLRSQEASCTEELRLLGKEWARHAVARHLVAHAKNTFERERQPQVIQDAGRFFSIITENAYTALHTPLDSEHGGDTVHAISADGSVVPPERMSRGTREQLYLALRLGYIIGHNAGGLHTEPLPVIMDDIFVNFDPTRTLQTAKALAELAAHNQIFFFTCHPQTAELLTKSVPDTAVHTVQDGQLQRTQ